MNIFEYLLLLAAVAVGGAGVIAIFRAGRFLRAFQGEKPLRKHKT
jgi:hypothetical protein